MNSLHNLHISPRAAVWVTARSATTGRDIGPRKNRYHIEIVERQIPNPQSLGTPAREAWNPWAYQSINGLPIWDWRVRPLTRLNHPIKTKVVDGYLVAASVWGFYAELACPECQDHAAALGFNETHFTERLTQEDPFIRAVNELGWHDRAGRQQVIDPVTGL